MFSKALVVLATVFAAQATVFVTDPTASSTISGGKTYTVRWIDDGKAPTLAEFGPAIISIYVGNAQQQTRLQTINPNVDVSKANEVTFTADATIGPNDNNYFVRFESIALKDAAQPQFPALSFSSKFAMDSMTGTFSADVLAQIRGQSTAPLASQPAATSGTTAPTTAASGLTSVRSSASASASARPSPTGAASAITAGGFLATLLSAVVGVAVL